MKSFTKTIAAGGSTMDIWPGKVLTVKSCPLALTVCFDGQDTDANFKSGRVYDQGSFRTVNIINPNSASVTVTYIIGDTAASYSPDDSSASIAASYALGNLAILNSAAATGSLPACNAFGYLQITDGMALWILGTNNGHRRQIITFSMSSTSPASLNILESNGATFMTLSAGDKIVLITDADFYLSGAGGTASVTVGQIFLLN